MRGKDSGGGGANWPCLKKLPMPRILPIHPEPATSSLHTVLSQSKFILLILQYNDCDMWVNTLKDEANIRAEEIPPSMQF